jgi:hypothetical protein
VSFLWTCREACAAWDNLPLLCRPDDVERLLLNLGVNNTTASYLHALAGGNNTMLYPGSQLVRHPVQLQSTDSLLGEMRYEEMCP